MTRTTIFSRLRINSFPTVCRLNARTHVGAGRHDPEASLHCSPIPRAEMLRATRKGALHFYLCRVDRRGTGQVIVTALWRASIHWKARGERRRTATRPRPVNRCRVVSIGGRVFMFGWIYRSAHVPQRAVTHQSSHHTVAQSPYLAWV